MAKQTSYNKIRLNEERILKSLYENDHLINTESKQIVESKIREINIPAHINGKEEKWKLYELDGMNFIVTTFRNIYAYGYNLYGEIGINQKGKLDVPTFVDLSLKGEENIKSIYSKAYSTFIVTTDSRIYACGLNHVGQLGINSQETYVLKFSQVQLPLQDEEVNSILIGQSTFILTTKSRIYACGRNERGQLGIDSKEPYILLPTLVKLCLNDEEKIKCIHSNDTTTYFETTSLRIYAAGYNYCGQLGIDSNEDCIYIPRLFTLPMQGDEQIKSIYTNHDSTYFSTTASKIYACGLNHKGQLGIVSFEHYISIPKLIPIRLEEEETIKAVNKRYYTTLVKTTSRTFAFGSSAVDI